MNLTELAKLCGCTPSTVSKAFRGGSGLHPDTRKRILDTAKLYGITVSTEQLVRGRTVIVLSPTYNSELYTRPLAHMRLKLYEHRMEMAAMSWEYDEDMLKKLPGLIRSVRNVCGIILLDALPEKFLQSFYDLRIPIIGYGQFDSIVLSLESGYRKAILHLLEHGRKNIAFIGENKTLKKELCFRHAMEELGIPCGDNMIYRSDSYSTKAGAEGFDSLFSSSVVPDAIICGYDYIALGVLNAAEAAGIDVPGNLAVIGADDIKAASAYRLGLTTLNYDYRHMALEMIKLLFRRIREPDAPSQKVVIEYDLIVRETG